MKDDNIAKNRIKRMATGGVSISAILLYMHSDIKSAVLEVKEDQKVLRSKVYENDKDIAIIKEGNLRIIKEWDEIKRELRKKKK